MTYEIISRTLHFREPAGTSRGTYLTRKVWYVFLREGDNKEGSNKEDHSNNGESPYGEGDNKEGCNGESPYGESCHKENNNGESHNREGVGECAPLPRLSCDDLPDYEERLHGFCRQVCETGSIDYDALRPYPSMLFGLECAMLMLRRGSRILFQTPFTQGGVRIPINGLVWMGTFEEMRRRMEEKVSAGFRCIKIKIGAIDWAQELELLRTLSVEFSCGGERKGICAGRREGKYGGKCEGEGERNCGGRCEGKVESVRVDANGAFSVSEAPARLQQLAALGIHSIEQPIRAGQWREMAHLCQSSPLPIALDEELIGVNAPERKALLLDTIRPQYIVLKPSLHGGLRGCDEWVRLATRRGIGWWVTSALESNVGLSAIAQWVSQYRPETAQGLGTGLLYTDNTEAETEVRGDELRFRLSRTTNP